MKKLLFLLLFPAFILAQDQPKVGLVLSGGGAKGFAHLGILKEIEKAGVEINYIGGTSMGAVIGGLYASGYTAAQIEEKILETNFMYLLQDKVPRREKPFFNKEYGEKYAISLPIKDGSLGLPLGLSKGQNVLNFLTELLAPVDDITDFSKLPIPFYCIATNIETGEEEVLKSGSLPLAVRASAAFPSLLNPVEIGNKLLIDGGVVNNFPVDVMKEKEVDIIIGVSVQGELLKREELTSIAALLSQIINFQMYDKSDKQVKLLDIYIRPDIVDYSVISFDKKDEILAEGERIAKPYRAVFDSIAKMQPNKKKLPKITPKEEKFIVDRINIIGNKNYTNNYILGKLQLREGDSVSYKQISKKINTLTASKNFKRIDYHFEKSFQGRKLEISVKEDEINSYLRLGLHYDLLYKSAVLLNYNHKKLLFQNDNFSFDIGIGDKIRYNLEYFVDNGLLPSYGFRTRYNTFSSDFIYSSDFINGEYTDFSTSLYLQTTYDKKFAVGVGVEHKNISASTQNISAEGKEDFFDKSNYINAYSFIKLDTYNKEMFPTKGFYVDVGFNWFLWSDRNNRLDELIENSASFQQFSQIGGSVGFATTFFNKLTLQYTSQIGYTLGKKESEIFDYHLGGYNQNYINNFIPMYGYDTGGLNNQSYLRSEFNFRYNFYKKHYAVFIANYARVEEDVFEGVNLLKNAKSGYALGYSLETFLGPIELKYSWSPDHTENYWLFNLGFWF
ncbi:patatin-like phospholipase family protein [Tenacibaculum tangerinum]|uniref:Patatin-like phospholipase family protein n=1 Tax=Tenacibaculum tangerinum TaxID=3038772 RepID=A0ABY8L0R7_9FLAO|nr:patatin-like phospholipase family protein [Tenacibaculum tangerinum]WGH74686.1 patatin-like phospholipase family protein [Tenacibaculum tangerinum]